MGRYNLSEDQLFTQSVFVLLSRVWEHMQICHNYILKQAVSISHSIFLYVKTVPFSIMHINHMTIMLFSG